MFGYNNIYFKYTYHSNINHLNINHLNEDSISIILTQFSIIVFSFLLNYLSWCKENISDQIRQFYTLVTYIYLKMIFSINSPCKFMMFCCRIEKMN